MSRVLPAIAIFIYIMFFTNVSFAEHDPQDTLQVSFVNNTEYTCTIKPHLKYGKWITKPPDSMPKHSSTYWIAVQRYLHGPDMTLKVTCGGYSFSTRNQQNYCDLEGGDQKHSAFDVDKHLKVTNRQVQHASYGGKKPGIAQISVFYLKGVTLNLNKT
ncbi:hypothetical protein [Candidatus Sororendozoicomonas aggregata]|uniref:hypothetical protein n=1 Tax=Candidatus Sororendozoicomonas aggregata TaxID=3073239 RepID=UPI002ED5B2CE